MILTRLTVVIILQYTHIPNPYVIHLKLIQCCMSAVSIKLERKEDRIWIGVEYIWMYSVKNNKMTKRKRERQTWKSHATERELPQAYNTRSVWNTGPPL